MERIQGETSRLRTVVNGQNTPWDGQNTVVYVGSKDKDLPYPLAHHFVHQEHDAVAGGVMRK